MVFIVHLNVPPPSYSMKILITLKNLKDITYLIAYILTFITINLILYPLHHPFIYSINILVPYLLKNIENLIKINKLYLLLISLYLDCYLKYLKTTTNIILKIYLQKINPIPTHYTGKTKKIYHIPSHLPYKLTSFTYYHTIYIYLLFILFIRIR